MSKLLIRSLFTFVIIINSSHLFADIVVNFDDGLGDGVPIPTDFYSGLGLTLENAVWDDVTLDGGGNSHPPLPGSTPLFAIISQNTPFGSIIPPSQPIVGIFATNVNEISITGLDVGENGARINVYDAAQGGNLIGFDEFFGTGSGNVNFGTLSVSVSGFRRFELFQPRTSSATDGLEFDNLVFAPVPEPSGLLVICFGSLWTLVLRRR